MPQIDNSFSAHTQEVHEAAAAAAITRPSALWLRVNKNGEKMSPKLFQPFYCGTFLIIISGGTAGRSASIANPTNWMAGDEWAFPLGPPLVSRKGIQRNSFGLLR